MIKQIGILTTLVCLNGCTSEPVKQNTTLTTQSTQISKPVYETFEHLSFMKAKRNGSNTIDALSIGFQEARAQRVRCNNHFSYDESFGDDNPNGKGYKYCQEMRNKFLDKGLDINLVDNFIDLVLMGKVSGVWSDQTLVDFAYGLIALSKSLNVDNSQFLDFVQDIISLFYKGALSKNAGKIDFNQTIKFLNTLPTSDVNHVILFLEAFSQNKISDKYGHKPDNIITSNQIFLLKKKFSSKTQKNEVNNYGKYGSFPNLDGLIYKR